MDIRNNQLIHSHLIRNKDFLDALKKEFDKNEIEEIIKYSKDLTSNYPKVMDNFYDWFCDLDADINVLTIGWDSDNWGAGGSGFIAFKLVFGIIKMTSSDYSDEHIEIFNKKTFFPWCIEHLMNDYIGIESDVYSDKELLTLAEEMGMDEDTKLTINGKEIER